MHDLIGDNRHLWSGRRNFIELNPLVSPAHVFRDPQKDPDGARFRLFSVGPPDLRADFTGVRSDMETAFFTDFEFTYSRRGNIFEATKGWARISARWAESRASGLRYGRLTRGRCR